MRGFAGKVRAIAIRDCRPSVEETAGRDRALTAAAVKSLYRLLAIGANGVAQHDGVRGRFDCGQSDITRRDDAVVSVHDQILTKSAGAGGREADALVAGDYVAMSQNAITRRELQGAPQPARRKLTQLLLRSMPIVLGRSAWTAPLLPQLVCENSDGGFAHGCGRFVFIRFRCFGIAVDS